MAGIEPASKKGENQASTCVAVCFNECSSSQQQDLSHFFAIDFASLALRKKARVAIPLFGALAEAADKPQ